VRLVTLFKAEWAKHGSKKEKRLLEMFIIYIFGTPLGMLFYVNKGENHWALFCTDT
jgi:hypothetical protein